MLKKLIKDNSSVLVAVGAGAGVLTTAYLAAQAGYKTREKLEHQKGMTTKEKALVVWKLYIPAGLSGAATIVCIVGVKHIDARKTLAAQTALAVSRRAYEGYRAQVIEELGERKDKTLLAGVAQNEINNNPPSAVVIGTGTVLCYEMYTGRYFNGDIEAINKAVNEINWRLARHDYATLDDLYYMIGVGTTSVSGQTGWESERLLELEYSSVLSPDGKPCLAFDYNYVKTL